jgi:putative membrane protein insertion efficiency factor
MACRLEIDFSVYERDIMKRILIFLIRFYRKYISPMKHTKCPYIPTCSEYGLEAIEKYGAFKGSLLAIWRILRCNPFSSGGYDPVP